MHTIDSHADIERGLEALCRTDRRLLEVRKRAGSIPLRRVRPGFASLVSIVVSQQVSRASADAILARFSALVEPMDPAAVLSADDDLFRKAGLSRPKQRTLVALSDTIVSGRIDLDGLCLAAPDDALAQLTGISGIGPWTAECYLLFAAGHADIFPAADVALQAAVAEAFALERRPSGKELAQIAESWSPWRGVASRLFWAYYRKLKGREAAPGGNP